MKQVYNVYTVGTRMIWWSIAPFPAEVKGVSCTRTFDSPPMSWTPMTIVHFSPEKGFFEDSGDVFVPVTEEVLLDYREKVKVLEAWNTALFFVRSKMTPNTFAIMVHELGKPISYFLENLAAARTISLEQLRYEIESRIDEFKDREISLMIREETIKGLLEAGKYVEADTLVQDTMRRLN